MQCLGQDYDSKAFVTPLPYLVQDTVYVKVEGLSQRSVASLLFVWNFPVRPCLDPSYVDEQRENMVWEGAPKMILTHAYSVVCGIDYIQTSVFDKQDSLLSFQNFLKK